MRERSGDEERAAHKPGQHLQTLLRGSGGYDHRLFLQQFPDVSNIAKPLSWILLQTFLDQPLELWRNRADLRVALYDGSQHFGDVFALKRSLARNHFRWNVPRPVS